MNVKIFGSNALEQLAKQLSHEMRALEQKVFQPTYIVTQTLGMNNWLKVQLAESQGIVANCRFVKPNDLVSEVYYKLGWSHKEALNSGSLQWVLFTLLATKDFQDRYRKIADYFAGDDVKRMGLAEKVADLFDQYQIYRADMIDDWNRGKDIADGRNAWQQYLWVQAKAVLGDDMTDKMEIRNQVVAALQQPDKQEKLRSFLPQVNVFGLSIITHYHIHLFYELSKVVPVNFYILNPAPEVYWFEDCSEAQLAKWRSRSQMVNAAAMTSAGNTLLTSWGKVLQETFSMFFREDVFINQYREVATGEPHAATLLGKVQQDIFCNAEPTDRNEVQVKDLRDGTITISACYTPAREVEALYNYLVRLVDTRQLEFAARDVVVMVSDIDAYAPYIKAIFNSAPYRFPYTIADESFAVSDNIFSALQDILALTEENFKSEEVLRLLDSRFIRKRFSISNIALVRRAVGEANIRFGIGGKAEDETLYVSWKNGIRRIILGICMPYNEPYETDGYTLYPLDLTEGEDAFELVRFCHFADVLMQTIAERRQQRSITKWCEYVEQVVNNMICQEDDAGDEDYQLLLKNLGRLYVLNAVVQDKISFEVFRHSFVNRLAAESRSNAFASGGITFCSLIPMRSIPFKVVALLGINFDKFPRRETRVSFDIMEQEHRKGDRNVKENDKHLFLETLLSAGHYLYISYIGRSAKDNTALPPSTLVDELVDYLQAGIGDEEVKVRDLLVTQHPLHSFSQKYLGGDNNLYNYITPGEPTAGSQLVPGHKAQEALSFDEVSLDKLIAFFKNPFKAFYNTVLGIRYEQKDALLPESEVFETEGLDLWQLRHDLLFLPPGGETGYRQKGVANGTLPLRNMADFVIDTTLTGLEPLKAIVLESIAGETERILNLEVALGGTVLKGQLNKVFGDKLVMVNFSKKESKQLLEAHIRYLFSVAAGHPLHVHYISATRRRLYHVPGHTASRAAASRSLQRLLQLYKLGHERILMVYPDFEKSPAEIAAMTMEKFDKMVSKHIDDGYADEYFRKAYAYGHFNDETVFEQYVNYAATVFADESQLFGRFYSRN